MTHADCIDNTSIPIADVNKPCPKHRPLRFIAPSEYISLNERVDAAIQAFNDLYSRYPLTCLIPSMNKTDTPDFIANPVYEIKKENLLLGLIDTKSINILIFTLIGYEDPFFVLLGKKAIGFLFCFLFNLSPNDILSIQPQCISPAETPWFYPLSPVYSFTLKSVHDAFNIHINPEIVMLWLKPTLSSVALTPVKALKPHLLVCATIEMTQLTFNIKEIKQLQTGNIITTAHPLTAPFTLRLFGHDLITVRAYQTNHYKSIKLVREPMSTLSATPTFHSITLPELEETSISNACSGTTAFVDNVPESLFDDLPVTCSLQLGTLTCSIGELKALKIEQIVCLDQKVMEPVSLVFHGKVFATGTLMSSGEYFAIKLEGIAS